MFVEARFSKVLEDAADFGIEVFHRFDVGLLRIRVMKFLRHIKRNVRHAVGEIDEEGFGFVLFDEVDGFIGVAASDAALINGEFDDLVVSMSGVFHWVRVDSGSFHWASRPSTLILGFP